jgi:hypothetical protein
MGEGSWESGEGAGVWRLASGVWRLASGAEFSGRHTTLIYHRRSVVFGGGGDAGWGTGVGGGRGGEWKAASCRRSPCRRGVGRWECGVR